MAKKKIAKKVSKKKVAKRPVAKKVVQPKPVDNTKKALHGSWFPVTMRALIMVLLGVYLLAAPTITLATLITTVGIILIAEGLLLSITTMIHPKEHEEWGISLFRGFLGILIGLFVLVQPSWWPNMSTSTLAYVVATVAIFIGLIELIHSIQLHKHLENKYLMTLAGLLGTIFGVLLLFTPIFESPSIIVLLGVYSIIFGVGLMLFSFELKLLGNKL